MPRHTAVYTRCLLILACINFSPIFANASTPSIIQAPRILQSDGVNNSTNATNPGDNSTDSNNATQPTSSPLVPSTPEVVPPPTPAAPTTHEPTRKYEPSSDDEEEEKEEEEKTDHRWHVVIGVVTFIAFIGGICYFRDPIVFFLGTVCINTNRYGCKGCLKTCFPCIFGSQLGGYDTRGGESLDQIIFETEDDGLRRNLMN